MFSLNNYPQVISYLKTFSSIFKINNTECVMFCPYCNDATRKINPSHGHLYLSVNYPVFHCFRCDTSGSLYQLLIDLNYPDIKDIEELKTKTKIKTFGDFTSKLQTKKDDFNILDHIFNFKKQYPNRFNQFMYYVKTRIGVDDIIKFKLLPDIIDKYLVVNFINTFNELTCSRFIDNNQKRYKKYDIQSGFYFFQNWDFEKYKKITICEGPFDGINLYLYNPTVRGSLFLSMMGKNYISAVDKLLETEITIGKYHINIIFDNDVKNKNFILNKIKKNCKKINDNVTISGYIPDISKDVGEYPAMTEI